MILSMTGFATSTVEIPLSNNQGPMILSMSIKSLNSRFFEMTCKIPSLLSNIEVPIQRLLQKQLHRGHVSLHIKIINSELTNEPIKPALHTIQNYLDAIENIRNTFKISDQVTLAQILQLPNALQYQEMQLDERIEHAIIQAISNLAGAMIETQKTEGFQLVEDIKQQIISLTETIIQIQQASHKAIHEKKLLLTDIITQLHAFPVVTSLEQKSTEQCLLETKKTTLMYEIEKIDINEETVRFNAHLVNLMTQLESLDPLKGKKLDFTIQELNREINTIASKCSHVSISSLAIDIKSQLEKAREQAQNLV